MTMQLIDETRTSILNQTLGYQIVEVTRVHDQQHSLEQDQIVEEHPIALVYNGISHVVMMATPMDIEVFVIGFSLSEGIVENIHEIYAIELISNEYGISAEIEISSKAFNTLKEKRRVLVGRTGCGLCGVDSLQQLQLKHNKTVTTVFKSQWLAQISPAMSVLNQQQYISQVTGGAHAAAWVVDGQVQKVFEDVGRHNALDKLLGYIAKHALDITSGFVIMTSRASYELVKKCIQFNIALLACISAPTTLAIDLARQSQLKLAGFCRHQGFVLYT